MQIFGLLRNIYKLARYGRTRELLKEEGQRRLKNPEAQQGTRRPDCPRDRNQPGNLLSTQTLILKLRLENPTYGLGNTLAELQQELKHAVHKYNTFRPHQALKGLTPFQYTQSIFETLLSQSESHML